MNIKRGLFRLWLLFALVFSVLSLNSYYLSVIEEFRRENTVDITFPSGLTIKNIPRDIEIDFFYKKSSKNKLNLGIVEPSTKLNLLKHPENLTPQQLKALTFDLKAELSKKRIPEPTPWTQLLEMLIVSFGIPLALLISGRSLMWAIAGFSDVRKTPES